MSDLLRLLSGLADGEHDDVSVAIDASEEIVNLRLDRESIRAQIAAEREAREKTERERDEALTRYARLIQTGDYSAEMKRLQTDCALLTGQRDEARAELARVRDAARPFARMARSTFYATDENEQYRIVLCEPHESDFSGQDIFTLRDALEDEPAPSRAQ